MSLLSVIAASRRRAEAFHPSSLTPTQWLVPTGASAATWPDTSGNGNDATQADTGKQPSIVSAVINGYQVRRFNGSAQFMAHTVNMSGDCTICAVAKSDAGDSGMWRILYSAAAPSQPLRAFLASQAESSTEWGTYRSTFRSSSYSLRGGFKIITLVSNSSGLLFRQNGAESSASDATIYSDGSNRRTVGASYADTGFDYFQGDIAEILVFPTALGTTDRQNVENYLNAKYNIY